MVGKLLYANFVNEKKEPVHEKAPDVVLTRPNY